jgi:L-asparagine transporter-like permease
MNTKVIIILVLVVLAIVTIFIVMKKSSDKKEQEVLSQQQQPQQASLGETVGGLFGMFASKGIENITSGKTVFGKDKKTKDSTDSSGYTTGDGWINFGE